MKIDKKILPHIFTFGNLCLGMLAIMLAVLEKEIYGSMLILVAAVLDRYDGKIARKLDAESELGKELDSLSDLVSFGLAPSLLAWHLSLRGLGWIGVILPLIFLSAGAYRLARYNITTFTNNMFTGVPITVAGAMLCIYNIYAIWADIADGVISVRVTVFIMALLSYLMISKFKIRKI